MGYTAEKQLPLWSNVLLLKNHFPKEGSFFAQML
jgi:hypothetical protein